MNVLDHSLKLSLFLLLQFSMLCVQASNHDKERILMVTHSGNINDALTHYWNWSKTNQQHDSEVLEAIGMKILQEGINSSDTEIQLLTLFGASISFNDKCIEIFQKAMKSQSPELQLVTLNILGKLESRKYDPLIDLGFRSSYPLVRFISCCCLAKKQLPNATAKINSFIAKLPESLHFMFPELFAMIGTNEALFSLKKLLFSPTRDVRVEAILAIRNYQRESLLEEIRKIATHKDPFELEACASALGVFCDRRSKNTLKSLIHSNLPAVQLASCFSLCRMGDPEARRLINTLAENGNLFAISLLGSLDSSEDLLFKLINHQDHQVRLNAAISLIKKHDPRALPIIFEILIKKPSDLVLKPIKTPGQTLKAWQYVSPDRPDINEIELYNETEKLKEELLEYSSHLSEKHFLELADAILKSSARSLVPAVVEHLLQLNTQEVVNLLRKQCELPGAPLVRSYCHLALYKMNVSKQSEAHLKNWIFNHISHRLIELKKTSPSPHTPFQLDPDEVTMLYLNTLQTMLQKDEQEGLNIIVQTLMQGNPINRFVLAGLLIRNIQ